MDDIALSNPPSSASHTRSLSKSVPLDPILKPCPPPKPQSTGRTEDDISVQSHSKVDDQSFWQSEEITASSKANPASPPKFTLEDFPSELTELIAGFVVGHLGSANYGSNATDRSIRNWNEIMRHPRRRNVANLALVSRTWRGLIQERIFRHIKLPGTIDALNESIDFFLLRPHLQRYVRHVQIIVPIWEMKTKPSRDRTQPLLSRSTRVVGDFGAPGELQSPNPTQWIGDVHAPGPVNRASTPWTAGVTQTFQPASQNATVEEIYNTVRLLFPDLCALTIEASHCKHPPQMKYFRLCQANQSYQSIDHSNPTLIDAQPTHMPLPTLPRTKTLILKGAWNIVRRPEDFGLLINAMPALQELHCSFHHLKTEAYTTMCQCISLHLPPTLVHLNVGLDGLYTKQVASLQKWRKIYPKWHICWKLGMMLPHLESLSYTGRVCHSLFSRVLDWGNGERTSSSNHKRLKVIDLLVNNVCCDPLTGIHNDAAGVHHYPFILAFERLVVAALRALRIYTSVNQIRIRFIDLDSAAPLLNPTFHLESGKAWGFYSDTILKALNDARPGTAFVGVRGDYGAVLARDRPDNSKRSFSMQHYRAIAHGIIN